MSMTEAPLPGFEHVRRYRCSRSDRQMAKILPGELYVTNTDEVVTTLLGSCVAACVWDPAAGVGGMNHFLIPGPGTVVTGGGAATGPGPAARYGIFAMELLINTILTHGGSRPRLQVKLAGGGHVIRGAMTVGEDNVRFAREYVALEGLTLVAEHVGGDRPRRVNFHPRSGRAQVLELNPMEIEKVAEREMTYASRIAGSPPAAGGIELF